MREDEDSTAFPNPKEDLRTELMAAQGSFHKVLESMTPEGWSKQSLNPGWSNGEILVHMTFGFVVVRVLLPMARLWGRLPKGSSRPFAWLLNAGTRPFNWVNGLGARAQGKVVQPRWIGGIFDRTLAALLKQMESIRPEEWQRGMYYPARWDPNFSEFMTLEKLLRYPVRHFKFHLGQLAH
ncbi:MAG: DinB family protein [Anaerolineae bacterium]|nr:MAG: DinB family protein [Anaerolineae bacterium]